MTDNSTRLHTSCNPLSPRLSVEELIGCQAVCETLRRHIGAELKRRDAFGWMDADDVFQEMVTRGLSLDREGPRDNVLNWLKRIATNYIKDRLREGKSRRRRKVEIEPGHEPFVLVENTKEVAEVVEVASGSLNCGERRFLQLCQQGSSAKDLASASGLRNPKAARDAKCRLYRKLRRVIVAMGAD